MEEKEDSYLKKLGLHNSGSIFRNLTTPALYEEIVRLKQGLISHLGPLVVRTGQYTGRSPKDKFIVKEPESEERISWGEVNQPINQDKYKNLRSRALAYLQGRDLYIQDVFAGADLKYQVPVRIITESPWHALFARNMFILSESRVRETDWEKLEEFEPEYNMIHAPNFRAIPDLDGTNSEVFVILNFGEKEILIGGTSYAGEMKKAVFTVMNYLLPIQGVLSMHCSANYGKDPDDVALFFGLSGTGKTTLSIDSTRTLIGDDEHGWGDDGIFNIEGGCYAKVIRISKEDEPEIYETTRSFGTVLENVAIDLKTRKLNLDDDSLTENTRAAFPISHLKIATRQGSAGHPTLICFLTADAFGVLPPISKLTTEQAIYYFLLGYTAKVAGTERGIKEPKATFSPCFGAPFMALDPVVYANMLGDKIGEHGVEVWLVNTGWTGGPYGEGKRINLPYTRSMVRAMLDGKLKGVSFGEDPVFGLQIPKEVPNVPSDVLRPRNTWKDKKAYDRKAEELVEKFTDAFKEFEKDVKSGVKEAGPVMRR